MKYNNQLPLPNGMTFLEACNFSIKLLYVHGFITRKQREVIWQKIEDDYWKEAKATSEITGDETKNQLPS